MTSSTSLRATVARALVAPLAFGVGAAGVLGVGLTWLGPDAGGTAPGDVVTEQVEPQDSVSADVGAQRAARLVARHDCWAGEPPADMRGRLPGHVVLTHRVAGEPVTTYGAERLVGRALEHLFGDTPDPGVVAVHGFCR